MKATIRHLLPILLTVLLELQLNAQNTAFTYQGRLDLNGTAATGIYDLRFRVASDAAGNGFVGAPVATNGVSVAGGLFTVTLDFPGTTFPGANRWLQIEVKTNGSANYVVLAPLQPITATPHAITAMNVTGTIQAGQVAGTLGMAQIPPAVVTNKASGVQLGGTFTGNGAGLTNLSAPSLTGLLPSGSIPDASITSSKLANAPDSLSKVAGGTLTSDGLSVDLHRDAYLNDFDVRLRGDSLHGLGWYGSGKLFAGVNVNGPAIYGNGGGVLGSISGTTNIALRWDATRNVTLPGTLYASSIQFSGNSFLNDRELFLRDDLNHGIGWYGSTKPFGSAGPDGPVLYGWSGGGLGYHKDTGTNIVLYWNASDRVGIGTSSPEEQLDVTNNARIRGMLRTGAETGTSEGPSPAGLIIRRVNSSDSSSGKVIARAGLATVERDGTPGGLVYHQLPIAMGSGHMIIALTCLKSTGVAVNVSRTYLISSTVTSTHLFADSDDVVYVHGIIANPDNATGGHHTEITLCRMVGNSRWVGTLTSTYNQ